MQRNTRQMSLKDCYEILHLSKGARLEDVKHSYRLLAFELHPDLHPNDPLAAKKFQELNEAYVALSAILKTDEQASEEPTAQATKKSAETSDEKRREKADKAYAEQDVLRDLLNDPFARRVFEDIYSELAKKQAEQQAQKETKPQENRSAQRPKQKPAQQPKKNISPTSERLGGQHAKPMPKEAESASKANDKGVSNFVKGWLKKQIDDQLTLAMPANELIPGRRLRLKIRHGLSNELTTIEVTIPPNFVAGKPIRLKGLGKHVGPWQGDLYLTLTGKEAKPN